MSLDVYLTRQKMVSYDKGKTFLDESEEVYWANITHNLGKMAGEANIYEALWHPERLEIKQAFELIPILKKGFDDLKSRPTHFEKFNSPNGWGMYEHFLPFVEKYLNACIEYPEAEIEVSV